MNDPKTVKSFCPECGQHIEAGAEYAGQAVDCPKCGASVQFPDIFNRQTDPGFIETPPPQRRQPPRRPNPALFAAVPETSVAIHYILPVLLLLVGGFLAIVGVGPVFIALGVFVIVLGHLGAIAARLKTIEKLLRNRP